MTGMGILRQPVSGGAPDLLVLQLVTNQMLEVQDGLCGLTNWRFAEKPSKYPPDWLKLTRDGAHSRPSSHSGHCQNTGLHGPAHLRIREGRSTSTRRSGARSLLREDDERRRSRQNLVAHSVRSANQQHSDKNNSQDGFCIHEPTRLEAPRRKPAPAARSLVNAPAATGSSCDLH